MNFVPLLTLFFIAATVSLNAETRSPFRTPLKSYPDIALLKSAIAAADTQQDKWREISPFKLSLNSAKARGLSITLNRVKDKTWSSYLSRHGALEAETVDFSLLRGNGSLRGIKGSFPVAGIIILSGEHPELRLDLQLPSRERRAQFLARITVPLTASGSNFARIRAISGKLIPPGACGAEGGEVAGMGQALSSISDLDYPNIVREIEIATEADSFWHTRFGTNSSSEIAAIINAAEVIYERDLRLTFKIKAQNVLDSSTEHYTWTDSAMLLSQFSGYTYNHKQLGDADVYHLFTGRNLDGNTIGRAWKSSICRIPNYVYGLTQYANPLYNYITFAHEIGHNLGAEHDPVLPYSVMNPTIYGSATRFSQTSINQIQNYVINNNSCLGRVFIEDSSKLAPKPTPEPTPTAGG